MSSKILVTGDSSSITKNILGLGVDVFNQGQSKDQQLLIDPRINSLSLVMESERDTDKIFILVTVSENHLDILEYEYLLKREYPVFLILQNPSLLSGFDCISAFLSGFVGIIDERNLSDRRTIEQIVDSNSQNPRYRNMLFISDVYRKIIDLKSMLLSWEEDEESEQKADQICWRVAMALAQLDKLKLYFTSSPQPLGFSELAKSLQLAVSQTSFTYNQSDLRKALGILGRRWLGTNHGRIERIELPRLAREKGFPFTPAIIHGRSADEIAISTFKVLKEISDIHDNSLRFAQKVTMRLPINKFRQLQFLDIL